MGTQLVLSSYLVVLSSYLVLLKYPHVNAPQYMISCVNVCPRGVSVGKVVSDAKLKVSWFKKKIGILPNRLSDALDSKGLLLPNSGKIEGRSVMFFFILFLLLKLLKYNCCNSRIIETTQNLKASIVIFYS